MNNKKEIPIKEYLSGLYRYELKEFLKSVINPIIKEKFLGNKEFNLEDIDTNMLGLYLEIERMD